MNRATNSAYMGKQQQQMQAPQQGGQGQQVEQMKQQIKMLAQKLMQEKGMGKDQAIETAKQAVQQKMQEQASGQGQQPMKQQLAQQQEGMPEYNMGGTIGTAVGSVAGSVIPGVGTAIGGTVGGAAGTLIGEAVGGGDNDPKQYRGRQREDYDTLMEKEKGQDTAFYKHGGQINKAPGMKSQYEAEGGEVVEGKAPKVTGEEGKMKEQTDDTYVVKGPSHEGGGVEGKGGNRVFTDAIKIPGTDKTYADAAKKIGTKTRQKSMEDKMEAKPYDQILQRSLDRTKQRNEAQKDKLFELQEKQKDAEGIGKGNAPEMPAKEYGGDIDPQASDKQLASQGDFGNDYDPALNDNLMFDESTGQYINKDIVDAVRGQQKAQRRHMQNLAADHGMSMEEFINTYPDQKTYQDKKAVEKAKDKGDVGTEMKYGGNLPKFYKGGYTGDPENAADLAAKKQNKMLGNPGELPVLDTIGDTELQSQEVNQELADNSELDTSGLPNINRFINASGDYNSMGEYADANTEGSSPKTSDNESPYGSNDIENDGMTPAKKNLYERMMKQQEKTDRLTPIGRAVQAAPAAYNIMDSNDRNYIKPQVNRRAQASIDQLEDMPTNFNIQDQLRSISDAYDSTTDQMNRYSASPNVARANMRNAFAKRLDAESQAYNTKENKETQLEAQKDKAVAQQKYQVGTQEASFRNQANMTNLKTQAAAERQKRTGLSQMANTAAGIAAQEEKKLSELQGRNLQYELLGDSGIASRMSSDPEFMEFLKKQDPGQLKKRYPEVYKKFMQQQESEKGN